MSNKLMLTIAIAVIAFSGKRKSKAGSIKTIQTMPDFKLHQRWPQDKESASVGRLENPILRGSPEFLKLIKNTNPKLFLRTRRGRALI